MQAYDLIEMRKMIAAASVIQSGAFKKELDEIAAATVELNTKMGVVKTLEQVEARRAEVVAELEAKEKAVIAAQAQLDEQKATADDVSKKLIAQANEQKALETALGQRETAITQAENKLKADQEAFAAKVMKTTATMDERQQRLVDRENKVSAAEREVNDRLAKVTALLKV